MKILIVPVFGLLLAACTYQFAPTGSDSTPLNAESSGEQTATASIDVPPADDGGFGPGGPGGEGAGGPPSPDAGDDGDGGAMPDFPDMPGGG